MNQKRNYNGEFISQHLKEDVFVPFRKHIPMGESKFEVFVPREFDDRHFYFMNLTLVPQFYSDQAQVFDLDANEELEELFEYPIYLKLDYEEKDRLYPGFYTPSIPPTTLQALVADINKYFELQKVNGCTHLGFFMDWMDQRFHDYQKENPASTWDDFVRGFMAPIYYGEPFDEAKHFNKLPPSARGVLNANNYLFPTNLPLETRENLYFRMYIAPNTRAVFSNPRQLTQFGFDANQIGNPNPRNQYEFPNPETMQFVCIEANNIPVDLEIKVINDLKIYLFVDSTFYISDTLEIDITKKDTFNNDKFKTAINLAFEKFSKTANLNLNVNYDPVTKKFKFNFPVSAALRNLRLDLPMELASRLGFGITNEIWREKIEGDAVDDKPDVKQVQQKSRALAYDTSLVIVSDDDTHGNTTSGIFQKFMAALFPTNTGAMEISERLVCNNPPKMKLPTIQSRSFVNVPVTFKLSRFLDNSQLVDLVWKNGAFVYGILCGTAN